MRFDFAQSRSFASYNNNNDDDKISPDTILFEGCDYNHWLITMDFPKDPKPTPEEMVETYVQTLAKVVGSVEEAKKRMYACSTTTYTGFQAVMTEEMSEKFRGLPGVVFILPDSYIDPVNKEYGGDKYINGTIIPRPPPVQYGRQQGRYGDRNRNYDRPRMSQQGQGSYGQRGPMPSGDGRNYDNTPPQQQNFAPTGPRGDGRYQGTYNQGGQGGNYYPPPEQRDRGNYSSPPPPPPPPHYGGADRQGGGGYGYNQNYSRQGGQQSNYSPENYSGQGGHQSNYSPETYSGQGGQQSNHSPVGQPGTDRGRY